MKLFEKEINPAAVTMWLNVVSFIIGILFYFRIEHNTEHPAPLPILDHSYDSLIIIDAKVNAQLKELKQVQQELISEITLNQKKLAEQTIEVNTHRQHIRSTINQEWSSLNKNQQNDYINQIFKNLKKQNRP